MAATNAKAALPESQSLLFGGVLSFSLMNGDDGIIAPEERRTYDHIIQSNVGAFPAAGLTESQVHSILSKSHLPEADLEQVWQLAITVEVEELQDGNWTPLEVYVALHYAQAYERLALDEMAVQYTGSLTPVLKKKVARRSSFAKARASALASADAPPMPTASASASASTSGPLKTRSLAEMRAPSVSNTLRRTQQATNVTKKDRRRHSSQASSSHDKSSVSQAGLEAVDEVEMVLRGSSVRSDTVDRAQRLASLIKARCPDVTVGSDIQPQDPRVRHASIADRAHAHDILVRQRRERLSVKNPTAGIVNAFRSKESMQKAQDTHTWIFNSEEKSHALREAVESGYVGVAEVLLDTGADVNAVRELSKSKILRTKTTTARPTNYLQVAASSNNVEMVNLLASRGVSQKSLSEALEKAVRQNLPHVVLTLLQYEADPNALDGTIFQAAIRSQMPVIVKLLLRARVKVAKAYLTASLLIAVSQGHSEIVSLLVAYGADVNDGHASALRKAVQAQRIDLVLTIMKGKPSKEAVSVAFEDAFSVNSLTTLPEKYLLIEVLLCGGAQGDCVAETLVRVVRAGHRNIARLLVLHGASLQYKRAEALRIVVAAGNLQLLDILLGGSIPKDCACDLFAEIPRPYTDQTYDLMSALIFKGATGTPLHEALVAAVQQNSVRVIRLLLDHNANADYNDAQAIQIAASAGDLGTVDLLLNKGRPRPQSMQHVLPLVPSGPPRLRYDMTKSIIDAASSFKIPVPVLDVALMQAIDSQSQQVDLSLVNLVIVAGANVDCLNGKCFQLATQRGSLELLELLVANMPLLSSLSSAVPEAMRVQQPAVRRKILALLLDHGAQGPTVSQALIDGMEENPVDESVVLSLLPKANVDYRGGQALLLAMCSTTKIVSSMVELGKPNQQTLVAALSIALDPATNDRPAKLDLLLKAGIDQNGLDNALVQEIINGPSYSLTAIKVLLRHHASCNYDGGKSLELAIRSRNTKMLEQLVGAKPDRRILGNMVLIAMDEADPSRRYRLVASLLHGGAKGDNISHALAQEVCDTRGCDLQLAKLLVQHNARIDYSEGLAIKHAVSALRIDLLRILVEGKEASRVLPSLIPLIMAHPQDVRLPLLQIILERSDHVSQIDAALVDAVLEGPASQETIDFLLQHSASVDFENGKAIKQACAAREPSVLQSLLDKKPNPEHLPEALRLAMQAPATQTSPNNKRRFACVKLVIRAGIGDHAVLDQALIQAVREKDLDLVNYLIDNDADPNFDSGKSVIIATAQADIESLVLLKKARPTPVVYSDAFSVTTSQTFEQMEVQPELLFNIDRILLNGGASGPAVDHAFCKALTSKHPLAAKFVDMVLTCQSSLDVNFGGGKSICLAAKENLPDVVRKLLDQAPNEDTLCSAFMSALESNAGESALIQMVKLFLERSNETKHIYFGRDDPFRNPFYQVLHRHADKPDLLQCLLDNGCRTDTPFSWHFTPEHGLEQTSGLLWLLHQADQTTDNRTVKLLLERGADPNFRTSGSGNSPLIVASAWPQPDLVLLLLQSGAIADTEDSLGWTPLHYATRAGCLDSMKHLLNHKADPNDESLHMAARESRADAVKLLLEHGASVDYPGILSCGGRTPLGEICRFTNPEIDPARLKVTLKALANAHSDPQKLKRDQSLIFHALDNDSPLPMTRLLLSVLPSLRENLNEESNIYRQTGGLCYSPTMYVRQFKCIEEHPCLDHEHRCCRLKCPAPALEMLLRAHGCQDRYWNDKSGANQPAGACGWPQHISEARKEADIIRKAQVEQARLRAEEQAAQEAKRAVLDAEAAAERQRELDLLAIVERKHQADAAEDQRRLEVAEEKRKAEARAERQKLAAIEAEDKAQADKERRAFNEQQERMRTIANEENRRKKRRDDQHLATLEKQAKLEKDVLRERKKLVDSANTLVRQTQIAGVGGQAAGRILGEIEGGRMKYLE